MTLISLNVGGKVFLTRRSALKNLPNTLLADLSDPDFSIWSTASLTEPLDATPEFSHSHVFNDMNANRPDVSYSKPAVENRLKYVYLKETNLSGCNDSLAGSSACHQTSFNPYCTQGGPQFKQACNKDPNVTSKDMHSVKRKKCSHQDEKVRKNSVCLEHEIFIDRNPVLIPYILDAYRSGQLHLPANVCSLAIRAELEFWKIPEDMISECCWKTFHEGLRTKKIVDSISHTLYVAYEDPIKQAELSWLGRVWLTMEMPGYSWASKLWCFVYYFFIFVSILAVILMTVPGLYRVQQEVSPLTNDTTSAISIQHKDWRGFIGSVETLAVIDYIIVGFFTAELLVRFIGCPEKTEFLRNKHNLLDVAMMTLTWMRWGLDFFLTHPTEQLTNAERYILVVLKCTMCLRIFSIFHVTKHNAGLKILFLSTKSSFQELMMLSFIIWAAILIFGTAMFVAEFLSTDDEQSLRIPSIPIAMWWAVVTITTVGYGDYYPVKPAGYVVGMLCTLTGLLLVSMPIAVVASNFCSYYDNMSSRNQSVRRGKFMKSLHYGRPEPASHGGIDNSTQCSTDALFKTRNNTGNENIREWQCQTVADTENDNHGENSKFKRWDSTNARPQIRKSPQNVTI